jgi:glycosyltransferase involved in cell wall biosynthesis
VNNIVSIPTIIPTVTGGLRAKDYFKQSLPGKPLITVITVVFNGVKHLEETIQSVLSQRYDNIEYLIIDGGSTDGTVDIIKKYEDRIDCWVSEKDEGVYDAMNKGLNKATGDFVININIGDLLLDIPESELSQAMQQNSDLVSFNVNLGNNKIFKPSVGFTSKLDNRLHHQGTFYSNNIKDRYDVTYKVFADFDLNQRLIKKNCKIMLCDKVVSSHSEEGLSHNREFFGEVWRIIEKNHGIFFVLIAHVYFRFKGLWNRLKN